MIAELWQLCHGTYSQEEIDKWVEVQPHVFRTQDPIHPLVYLDKYYFSPLSPFSFKNPQTKDGEISIEYLEQLQKTAKRMNGYADKEDWETLFGIIDKKIGLLRFVQTFTGSFNGYRIPTIKIWDAFVEVYTRGESGFEILQPIYSEVFKYAKFSEQRKRRVANLKKGGRKTLHLYHGHKMEDDPYNPQDHYSWTLDERIALNFATRFNTPGEVWEVEVPISQAIDYLTDRNEEEVLLDYEYVSNTYLITKKYLVG